MLRVLCLHGHRQTAEIFENQVSKLRQAMDQNVEWVFLDAPYELPRSHVDDDVCTRSWSAPSPACDDETEAGDADALYAAADALVDEAFSAGAYDVLFGFSQGAIVLYRFLVRHWDHATGALETPYSSIKGFMVAGAPDPRRRLAAFAHHVADGADCVFGHRLPSLHMVGRKDSIVSPDESERFAEACGPRAELLVHEHAHCVPQLQANLRVIKDFLEGLREAQDSEEAEMALEGRRSELEMIASMYEDSVSEPEHPRGATVSLPLFTDVEDRVGEANVAAALARLRVQFHVPRRYPAVHPEVTLVGGTRAHSVRLGQWRATLLQRTATFMHEDMAAGTAMLLPIYMFMNEQAEETLDELHSIYAMADGNGEADQDGGADKAVSDEWALEDDSTRASLIDVAESRAADILLAWRGHPPKKSGAASSPVDVHEEMEHSTAATGVMSKQSGGSWGLTIGLIGKPSAGKSTLFNAVTDPESESAAARVAAFPFTTIEPNVGTAFGGLRCPCRQLCGAASPADAASPSSSCLLKLGREACDAEYGHVRAYGHAHNRRHPIRVKDVAGLVQGAYQGRGKGNQFLNDLCDADVLVHVVDGAAATDADGTACVPGQGSALEDIGWVRAEMHSWIYDNIKAKWSTIFRLPHKLRSMFSGYRSSPAFVDRVLRRVGIHNETELALQIKGWGPRELHLFIALYVHLRFPMVVALNKADLPTAGPLVDQLHARYPHETFVPMTAMTEWNLLCLRKKGYINYISGEPEMVLTESGKVLLPHTPKPAGGTAKKSVGADPLDADIRRLQQVQAFFATQAAQERPAQPTSHDTVDGAQARRLDGSTGVQNVVFTALAACAAVQVIPVSAFQPAVPSLQHCFTFKEGTTAEDIFWAMTYAKLLDGKLVRFEAIDATQPMNTPAEVTPAVLKREATMPSRAVLVRILSNKRQMN